MGCCRPPTRVVNAITCAAGAAVSVQAAVAVDARKVFEVAAATELAGRHARRTGAVTVVQARNPFVLATETELLCSSTGNASSAVGDIKGGRVVGRLAAQGGS